MNDEFAARQCAITLRLNGRSVKYVCSALGRSEFWFYNGGAGHLAAAHLFPSEWRTTSSADAKCGC